MKKIIICLFVLVVTLVIINEQEHLLIPDNAIRFRVIGSSNDTFDQKLKMQIKDEVEDKLYVFLKDAKTIDEAREIINNNLDEVDKILNKYNINYDISFGNNYIPEKEYKGIKYPAGNYESLVITLGSGQGKNWWCVLFPPLCLLDENNNIDDVEYELYAQKLINKFK